MQLNDIELLIVCNPLGILDVVTTFSSMLWPPLLTGGNLGKDATALVANIDIQTEIENDISNEGTDHNAVPRGAVDVFLISRVV